ncbi:tetratricopeptide repeat protein [Maribacter sp. Asnod1-A12]|uniref:tetratricopeptide repeat protein n=1 Tax=Maribacter sp. Asnod1-A12 TaxID=3160576 RepID=UPI00387060FB
MKKSVLIVVAAVLFSGSYGYSQTKSELLTHYEAFYDQMRLQGDVDGVINALTHLNILSPSQQRNDTLAYIYANDNQHLQALNIIGIEKVDSDSNLAIQVKAVSLKALNQPKRALEQFEALYAREPNAYLAYELADLKVQTGDNVGAMKHVEYGITNATDDMKYAFYERQQPYEVPLKAAFIHVKALIQYNMDKSNIDQAIATLDEALAIDPNFNLASLSKQALSSRKDAPEEKK